MAIASSPTRSFCSTSADLSSRLPRLSTVAFIPLPSPSLHPSLSLKLKPLSVSSRLNSSKPSENGDLRYDLNRGRGRGSDPKRTSVFVKLPLDAVGPTAAQVRRRKTMEQSFRALVAAGVEGVVLEVWWGLVERDAPKVYIWQGYKDLIAMAKHCGLKVRVVLAFHQCGTGPADPHWIPLPLWVLEEINKNPDLAYSDRFGRKNIEYISLGCDTLPVLQGRSPIQAYADFMRAFRDAFWPLLGAVITGIQVGMGPAGELRYPSCPSRKLTWPWRTRELGEFQCYDKYMLASLNARAQYAGKPEWGNGGPIGASNLLQNPEDTDFFKNHGSWNTPYGKFFLEWYSGMLLLHGENICREAKAIFRGAEVNMLAKVAGIHWHYGTQSHASELTAGYYNTDFRDGYLPIARMLARYGFTLCCTGFDMQDAEEQEVNPFSRPEGFLKQLLLAAIFCHIPMEGENFAPTLDDGSFQQVLKMVKFCSDGQEMPSFSFSFERMDKNMFDYQNWVRFTRLVRQLSGSGTNNFRAKLDLAGCEYQLPLPESTKVGMAFAHC
ncbi:hypothetical protein SLA2020_194730 [Shorea laevis]